MGSWNRGQANSCPKSISLANVDVQSLVSPHLLATLGFILDSMKIRIPLIAAALGALFLAFAAVATATIPIYSNDLTSVGGRGQMANHEGKACKRGGSKKALKVTLGSDTRACSFRPPVVGRDLEISVAARLLSGTPTKLRGRAYVAAGLRAGDGGMLTVRVFPAQKKLQLIQLNPDGSTQYLAIAKQAAAIRDVNQSNRIYLRAFNQGEPGSCRVLVRVNGKRLAVKNVSHCAALTGRDAIIEAGATRGGEGVVASFTKLRIGVPDPFAQ